MAYLPIENYGVIGDCHTVALVGLNGSIDWLCFPVFDSPSVFGALLDDQKGGRFQIVPAEENYKARQMYLPDTNILITRFFTEDGLAELTDFMPVDDDKNPTWNHRVVRQIKVIKGSVKFRLVCQPAFDYARAKHTIETFPDGVAFRSKDLNLSLVSQVALQVNGLAAEGEFNLKSGQDAIFILQRLDGDKLNPPSSQPNLEEFEAIFQQTSDFWRKWLAQCTYTGRWREMVHRSALVLKLLTYAPNGAIIAAPTTSLPEVLGAGRNWDYRYIWIRDASFTCYALLSLGFNSEAGRFMEWIASRCRELDPKKGGMQVMYGIDGRAELAEENLDHLEGYCGSKPVRIGNAAYKQTQLDIYGELMDAAYLYNKYAEPISHDQWTYLRDLMDWLCKNWRQTDSGLWEVRSAKQPFVYSRFMIWVALDRAIRIANQRGLPADIITWREVRDKVYEEVMEKGWNEKRQAFVQYYGSDLLDASNLLMPLVKFVGPSDPRMLDTLERTLEELAYDALVFRYDKSEGAEDGLSGQEGSFCLCSFWLVECLTRVGRLDEARLKLEKMFGYANHLGLYAEEIGRSGEMLGNYPQAFTHLGLISAAINLDRALNKNAGQAR